MGRVVHAFALACLLVMVAVTAMTGFGCSADEPPGPVFDGTTGSCTPANCMGCCQGGTCVDPPTNAACGTSGLPCEVCTGGKVCMSGSCVPSSGGCDTLSCTSGCCQNDQCLPGNTNVACGQGGLSCVDCTLTGGTCDPTTKSCKGGTPCGPASCAGGCCQAGQCLPGSTNLACGMGGVACVDCTLSGGTCNASTQSCQGGSACNASTCGAGCCQNNQCLPGNTNPACGTGAVACVDCTAAGGTCDPATKACQGGSSCGPSSCASGCCQNNQCLSGTSDSACGSGGTACQACGPSQSCTGQQCSGTGENWYKVTLGSGQLLGNAWLICQEGNCDMYVELTVGSLTATSSMILDNNSPVWNEYLLVAPESELTASFVAKVYDDDYGPNIKIGECTPTVTAGVLASGSLSTTCSFLGIGDTVELTFTFQKQ